jgi:hypothetical protein
VICTVYHIQFTRVIALACARVLNWISLSVTILGAMEYAEDEDLVRVGRANLVDNDIGQPAHHLFMCASDAPGASHTGEFGQTLCCQPDAGDDMSGRSRIAIPDVTVN